MGSEGTIRNIQKEYQQVLEAHFKDLWEAYKVSNLSVPKFLQKTFNTASRLQIVHSGRNWTSLAYQGDQLLSDIAAFWAVNQQLLSDALKESDKLYTQVGDLNGVSSYYSQAVLRLGLYFDNICLLDPLAIMAQRRQTMDRYLLWRK